LAFSPHPDRDQQKKNPAAAANRPPDARPIRYSRPSMLSYFRLNALRRPPTCSGWSRVSSSDDTPRVKKRPTRRSPLATTARPARLGLGSLPSPENRSGIIGPKAVRKSAV
jgi:hypothetical protein